jgi:hypothetical protein
VKRDVPIVPYGYRLDSGALVPDPAEQAVIAIVRDGRARDVSFVRLAAELTARGYRTRGGKAFYQSAVFQIARALESQAA